MGARQSSGILSRVLAREARGRPRNAAGRRPEWRYRLLRMLKPRRLYLDGFDLIAWRSTMPKHIAALLARGDYEGPERRALVGLLRPGDRVLEIGGCIGLLSLIAARIVGPENVLVYEPNPQAADTARRNFDANGMPIRLVERAVDAVAGTATLSVGHQSWLGASMYQNIGEREIAVTVERIGDIVAKERPTALVLDAEGAEVSILTHCPLRELRLIVLELHPDLIGEAGVVVIRHTLTAAGFMRIGAFCEAETEAWLRDCS